MERLTKRENGHAHYPRCFEEPCGGMGCCTEDCEFKDEICERLAAYEDTELTRLSDLESICSYTRLRELVEADKAGRVVVLPVRPVLTQSIGSMLYIIEDKEIVEDSLCEALVGMGCNGEINIFYTTLSDQISFEQADIGKTVFLTHEKAKAALEAMKDG